MEATNVLVKQDVQIEVNPTKKRKRKRRNYMIEEGDVLKVFTNTIDTRPFIFDVEERTLLEKYTIYRHKNGYATAHDSKSGKKALLHRVIMGMLDKPSMDFIDHIDGDKSNNRKSNLRICHSADASNQKNLHYTFPNGEKVQRSRMSDDKFLLSYTDGIMPYIEFIYDKFEDLIAHYKSLYESGFERTTMKKLHESQVECSQRIEISKSSGERTALQQELGRLIELIKLIKLRYFKARELFQSSMLSKGLLFVDDKLKIVSEVEKTPKEIINSGIEPLIIYYGNHHDKELASKHKVKPDGELIY